MTSQVLNFLWLGLDLPAPPDPKGGGINRPLPEHYINNIRKAGARHPAAEVDLWVDSKRLTRKQMDYLRNSIEDGLPNVRLKDLRDIPAYDLESLFNQPETNPNWRNGGQSSLIWRQVDAAKILISLQGDFDQTFFADLDHAHLNIESRAVQETLNKHGLLFGSFSKTDDDIENQLWGFTPKRRDFFESYFTEALEEAYDREDNAYDLLLRKVQKELVEWEKTPRKDLVLMIGDDGSKARHPGHRWRDGSGDNARPISITKNKLAQTFNKGKKTKTAATAHPKPRTRAGKAAAP